MARYVPDPTRDSAGFPIFPKGDYRLRIGEFKAFEGETKQGKNAGQKNFGVATTLTIVPGPIDEEGNETPSEYHGQKAYQRLFFHSEDSQSFRKNFLLAAHGYTPREEKEFNEFAKNLDWSFDTDTGEVGDGWKQVSGRELVVSMSISTNEQGQENQKWEQMRPVPNK